jgi:hypothetical protein
MIYEIYRKVDRNAHPTRVVTDAHIHQSRTRHKEEEVTGSELRKVLISSMHLIDYSQRVYFWNTYPDVEFLVRAHEQQIIDVVKRPLPTPPKDFTVSIHAHHVNPEPYVWELLRRFPYFDIRLLGSSDPEPLTPYYTIASAPSYPGGVADLGLVLREAGASRTLVPVEVGQFRLGKAIKSVYPVGAGDLPCLEFWHHRSSSYYYVYRACKTIGDLVEFAEEFAEKKDSFLRRQC